MSVAAEGVVELRAAETEGLKQLAAPIKLQLTDIWAASAGSLGLAGVVTTDARMLQMAIDNVAAPRVFTFRIAADGGCERASP